MKVDIAYITGTEKLEMVRSALGYSMVVGGDTETTSLDPYLGRTRTVQLSTVAETFVLDVDKLGAGNVREAIGDILLDEKKVKVFMNGKFDVQFMHKTLGLPLRIPNLFDVMLADQLLTGGQLDHNKAPYGHGLGDIAQRYCGTDLSKKYQKVSWDGTLFKEQILYAGLDSFIMLPLFSALSKELQRNQLENVALLEFLCIEPTSMLELNGMKLDKVRWLEASRKYRESNEELGAWLVKILGRINYNSPQQVQRALRERLNVHMPSLNKDSIKTFIDAYVPERNMFDEIPPYDVVEVLTNYQQYKEGLKACGTYGEAFFKHINPVTGRVHTSFKQAGADTGRFTSSDPNLQNIPAEAAFRHAFVAEEGNDYIIADYSQIELRILADVARISSWIKTFREDGDLHKTTADAVQCVRKQAKIINFSTAYGGGASNYSRKANVPMSRAQADIRAFYRSVPEFSTWLGDQETYFRSHNLIRSASGRMRVVRNWMMSDDDLHYAKQASRNFPIQATSADILKKALVLLARRLPAEVRLVNIVHDEIVLESPKKLTKEASRVLKETMIEAGEFYITRVPVNVDLSIANCWGK